MKIAILNVVSVLAFDPCFSEKNHPLRRAKAAQDFSLAAFGVLAR